MAYTESQRNDLVKMLRNARNNDKKFIKLHQKTMDEQLYSKYFKIMDPTCHYIPSTSEGIYNTIWEKMTMPDKEIDPIKIDTEFIEFKYKNITCDLESQLMSPFLIFSKNRFEKIVDTII